MTLAFSAAGAWGDTTAVPSPDEAREIRKFFDDLIDQLEGLERDYVTDMQKLGWHTVLEPWHIDQDKSLNESRRIARDALATVDKYETKTAAVVRDFRGRIGQLAVSEEIKLEIDKRVERGLIIVRLGDLWKIEKQAIARVGDIIKLLSTSKRGLDWTIQNDQLVFARGGKVLAKHDAYMVDLQRLAEKKYQIQKESADIIKKRKENEKRAAESGE